MAPTLSIIIASLSIGAGLLISPIPKNLGLYTYIASKMPVTVGLTPAFHHGIEWNYTFDKLYNSCSDIQGQNALITGANSGVGYETAKALAKCGVHVTMICRNPKKCDAAAEMIREASADNGYENAVTTMTADTSKLASVQKFSKEFLSMYNEEDKALDMLYLNAGIGAKPVNGNHLSEDGIELVFATNYVGHHLMYRLLEPLLQKSKMARVVQTSSAASFTTFPWKVATSLEQLNELNWWKTNADMRWYGQSKLAQIMWAKHLTKRLGANSNIYVNAAHPGAVDTAIWMKNDNIDKFEKIVTYFRENAMWTSEEGALTQIYLGAAVREIKEQDIRGKFFHPQVQEVVNPLSLDEKIQEDLWAFSDELVAKFL